MKNFLTALAIGTAAIVAAMPASAENADNWSQKILEGSKAAEREVARANVRVASLGATEVDSGERAPRARRAPSSASEDRPQTRRTRVASLNASKSDADERPRRSLSGGSVSWTADAGCLAGTLRGVIRSLASSFGPVTVNSTCRSRSRNASVGGAQKSYHLQGEAVDFRVHGNVSAVFASLRDNGSVGGLKHYGGGLFHIDTGPRRSW